MLLACLFSLLGVHCVDYLERDLLLIRSHCLAFFWLYFFSYETKTPGPNGERYCWYQCTVMGGRETRDLGAYELARACEALGAGEILLNSIDKDGTNSGFDLEFVRVCYCYFLHSLVTQSLELFLVLTLFLRISIIFLIDSIVTVVAFGTIA